ncbi:hypothetical protein DPX16_22255 [Anabarilius grahami]|uniref:Uncharacterized protein n=1 Tax=Anabarilius grahami TaxID=495550 RepID=A0A3N0XNT5_ANAGA|nr:hypothetical protein DPX16_22255 [Anabarilius grahami]
MNSVNSLQLFLLVWTFTAVGRADDDLCSVSCKNVTGTVGEEITLICNVSQKCSESCITLYKFYYPEIYNDSICKQNNSCEQRNSFTCRYTPTTVMTGKHGFFLQTQKAVEITEFTVNITGTVYNTVVYNSKNVCNDCRMFKV